MWGSKYTIKKAILHGDRAVFSHSLIVLGHGRVFTSTRVLVYEVARSEELDERRRAQSVDHAGLRSKSTVRGKYLPLKTSGLHTPMRSSCLSLSP